MTSRALPTGLTHPYEALATPRSTTFAHGHTFTWVRGDRYVAVQRGRVLNATRARIIADAHPEHEPLVGKHPVTDWIPAPSPDRWAPQHTIAELADHWSARQHRTA